MSEQFIEVLGTVSVSNQKLIEAIETQNILLKHQNTILSNLAKELTEIRRKL